MRKYIILLMTLFSFIIPAQAEQYYSSLFYPTSIIIKSDIETDVIIETENFKDTITVNGEFEYNLVFRDIGEYIYTIYNEDTKYTLYISVFWGKDNQLDSIKIIEKDDVKVPELFFSGKRCYYTPIIEKIIKDYDEKINFTFLLEGITTTSDILPMPKNTKLIGNGELSFGEIEFIKPGTYIYKIKELQEELTNWEFDTSEYILEITVNKDFELKATIISNNKEVDKIIFINKYIPETTIQETSITETTIYETTEAPSTTETTATTSIHETTEVTSIPETTEIETEPSRTPPTTPPDTGDNFNFTLWSILCISALISFIYVAKKYVKE